MANVHPFLWFDGSVAEASEFYQSLFPDAELLNESPLPPGIPGPAGELMAVSLRLAGQDVTLFNGGPAHQLTEAFSLMIACADQAEVDHYWAGLGDGGTPIQCGWITDRFGVTWQVVPNRLQELLSDPDPARASRAAQAMMQMVKLDIAELEAAADAG